jgi:hypothetical protein
MAEATPNITENTLVVEGDGNNVLTETECKLPKNSKENRYYYRHREELLEKRRLKRLQDPEYQAKLKEREEKKKQKEEEKKKQREEERKRKAEEKAKKKAELLGILPKTSPRC